MAKLLFIDDDEEFLLQNKKFFIQEGYIVKAARSGVAAVKALSEYTPDCIILDVMMPEMDGYETCKKIREITNVPVIFLSGLGEEDDKVKGLMTGGDDYLVKPFSYRELSARIAAQLRRFNMAVPDPNAAKLEFPPLTLDLMAHKAYCEEEEIPLSNKEYELLYMLAANPNTVFTFEEIGNKIWGYYEDADRRTITVTASRLRKKMENYAGLGNMIETEWSKGYKFVAR